VGEAAEAGVEAGAADAGAAGAGAAGAGCSRSLRSRSVAHRFNRTTSTTSRSRSRSRSIVHRYTSSTTRSSSRRRHRHRRSSFQRRRPKSARGWRLWIGRSESRRRLGCGRAPLASNARRRRRRRKRRRERRRRQRKRRRRKRRRRKRSRRLRRSCKGGHSQVAGPKRPRRVCTRRNSAPPTPAARPTRTRQGLPMVPFPAQPDCLLTV